MSRSHETAGDGDRARPTAPGAAPAFDAYAGHYVETVSAALALSGENATYFPARKARLAAGLVGVHDPRRILDFGCGIGMTTLALARAFPRARVTGVDESAESLAAARRSVTPAEEGTVTFLHTPPPALPFADGAFDLVFTSNVFHHIPPAARPAAARELARVTAPGGRVLVFELNPLNPLTVRVTHRIPFDAGVQLLRLPETAALLRAAGLEVGARRYYFFFPRLLRALRVLEPVLGWVPLGAQYVVGARRT